MRLDPLTQSITVTVAPPAVRATPAGAEAPTEIVARFVGAAAAADTSNLAEGGYGAARDRRAMARMASLSRLDSELSKAAAGLLMPASGQGNGKVSEDTQSDAVAATRRAELRGAAAALNTAIAGSRAEIAVMLRQMQLELAAALEAISEGKNPGLDMAAATNTGPAERLLREAQALTSRAVRD